MSNGNKNGIELSCALCKHVESERKKNNMLRALIAHLAAQTMNIQFKFSLTILNLMAKRGMTHSHLIHLPSFSS